MRSTVGAHFYFTEVLIYFFCGEDGTRQQGNRQSRTRLLEEVKGYYAEKSFLSDVIENVTDYNINDSRRTRLNSSPTDDYYKKDKYTYTDSHGYGQEVYSDDEKNFYDAGGHFQFEGEKQGDKIVVNKPKTYDDEDNTNINKLDNYK